MEKSTKARKGGFARVRLYGNPGTVEGRRLGGLRSVVAQKKKHTGFIQLRPIPSPRESTKLAELFGILAGDGHISEYQVSMTTNSETDMEHALHVKSLFESIFPISVSFGYKRAQKACVVYISSKNIVTILVKKGMVRGNKIQGGLRMPNWIQKNKSYKRFFIRGLFDTDGCVYVDTHRIGGVVYKNIGMAFTNRCIPLLEAFKQTVEDLGLHPTQKTKYTVFLRREKEIKQYFALVGSSNPKHLQKIASYFSKKGGVA